MDTITWQTPTGKSKPAAQTVYAHSNWIHTWDSSIDNGNPLVYQSTGAGGYYNHTVDVYVSYCTGDADFYDVAGNYIYVGEWVNGSTSSHPFYNNWYGTVSGTGCQ